MPLILVRQVTDVFTYTVKDDADKNASTATLTITVTGINDDITAVNDTDAVNAGSNNFEKHERYTRT